MSESITADYSKMKVADLKKELKAKGLSIVGNRNELLERIQSGVPSQLSGDADNASDHDPLDEDEVLGENAIEMVGEEDTMEPENGNHTTEKVNLDMTTVFECLMKEIAIMNNKNQEMNMTINNRNQEMNTNLMCEIEKVNKNQEEMNMTIKNIEMGLEAKLKKNQEEMEKDIEEAFSKMEVMNKDTRKELQVEIEKVSSRSIKFESKIEGITKNIEEKMVDDFEKVNSTMLEIESNYKQSIKVLVGDMLKIDSRLEQTKNEVEKVKKEINNNMNNRVVGNKEIYEVRLHFDFRNPMNFINNLKEHLGLNNIEDWEQIRSMIEKHLISNKYLKEWWYYTKWKLIEF